MSTKDRAGNRVLVTGASSALGQSLSKCLYDNGYSVVATGRNPESLKQLVAYGITCITGDLLKDIDLETLCAGHDTIFHLAALSSPWGRAGHFKRMNVDLTANLLSAAKNNAVSQFVFVSSPSIYTQFKDQDGITESDLPTAKPLNLYAKSKIQAEACVNLARSKTFQTLIIRPRAIVGPGDKTIMPRLRKFAQSGRVPLLRNGRALIEFTDIRDVVAALMLAEKNCARLSGRAINISGGRPISVKDISSKLAKAMGLKIKFAAIPMPLAYSLAILSELKARSLPNQSEPKLTRYSLATLAYSQTFNLSIAEQALGYVPHFDATETLLREGSK